MKLKDKIVKNRVGILIFIGVLLVVTIIIGISYAYFFNIEIKNNNTISGNINTKYYVFESSGNSNLSLTLNQSDLDMATASNDYSSFVSGNGGNINVSLNANGLKKVYCSYDLVYEPVSAYTKNVGATNAGLKEFTLSGTSDKGNSFSEIEISGSNKVTLISGVKISTDTNILENWNFTVKYYNLDVIQDNVVGKTFKGNIKIANTNCSFNDPNTLKGYETILLNNGNGASTVEDAKAYIESKGTPDFSKIATTNEGMYAAEDDLGTSYYFRGAVDNNWVKYGKFKTDQIVYRGFYDENTTDDVWYSTNDGNYKLNYLDYTSLSDCNSGVNSSDYGSTYNYKCKEVVLASKGDDMYWRIVRIDKDDKIRMIYAGNKAPTEDTKVSVSGAFTTMGMSTFNSNFGKSEYVGFKYILGQQHGTGTDSTIKTYLDSWYTKYFNENLSTSKFSTTSFCNDRNVASGVTWTSTGSNFNYAANDRLSGDTIIPTFACNTADNFTNNLGLITADEIVFAGGKFQEANGYFYLNNGFDFWLSSPSDMNSQYGYVNVFGFYSSFGLYGGAINYQNVTVRGVISLSSEAKLSGDGTWNNVYTVN